MWGWWLERLVYPVSRFLQNAPGCLLSVSQMSWIFDNKYGLSRLFHCAVGSGRGTLRLWVFLQLAGLLYLCLPTSSRRQRWKATNVGRWWRCLIWNGLGMLFHCAIGSSDGKMRLMALLQDQCQAGMSFLCPSISSRRQRWKGAKVPTW